MLEQMRRSSQSLLIYLLFGIVIAVFIINFGPQSGGGYEEKAVQSSFAARVGGTTMFQSDWRYAFVMSGGDRVPLQQAKRLKLKELIMDRVIERELLAQESERLGFRVGEDEVEDMLAESKIMGGGVETPVSIFQKDGKFDYDSFAKFVRFQLAMTPKSFIAQQRREMLAGRLRQVLREGVSVSAAEVKDEFDRKNNQVNLEYVRFSSHRYENELELGQAEIAAYATANDKKLKDLYEQRKFLYEKAPQERHLRQILLKLDGGASKDAEAAVKKKADGLLTRIKKGEAFAAVAKAATDDARTKHRGGDLGWRRQGATALPAGAETKAWAAKDGEVIGPEKGTDGFYLVQVAGTREGDLTFDRVKLELAEGQLREDRAKERARAEATAALSRAKVTIDKPLKDLFPVAKDGASDERPAAEETGLFARRGAVVEGLGTSPDIAKAAFALTTAQPFAGPFDVSGSAVVIKLKERKTPDADEFSKKKVELMAAATTAKGEKVVEEWALRRCNEAKQAKRIEVNKEYVRYDEGPDTPISYEPCTPPTRF